MYLSEDEIETALAQLRDVTHAGGKLNTLAGHFVAELLEARITTTQAAAFGPVLGEMLQKIFLIALARKGGTREDADIIFSVFANQIACSLEGIQGRMLDQELFRTATRQPTQPR